MFQVPPRPHLLNNTTQQRPTRVYNLFNKLRILRTQLHRRKTLPLPNTSPISHHTPLPRRIKSSTPIHDRLQRQTINIKPHMLILHRQNQHNRLWQSQPLKLALPIPQQRPETLQQLHILPTPHDPLRHAPRRKQRLRATLHQHRQVHPRMEYHILELVFTLPPQPPRGCAVRR